MIESCLYPTCYPSSSNLWSKPVTPQSSAQPDPTHLDFPWSLIDGGSSICRPSPGHLDSAGMPLRPALCSPDREEHNSRLQLPNLANANSPYIWQWLNKLILPTLAKLDNNLNDRPTLMVVEETNKQNHNKIGHSKARTIMLWIQFKLLFCQAQWQLQPSWTELVLLSVL